MEALAEPQLDEPLLHSADPILAELEYLCLDAHGCVSLTDPMGTIAVFRGEPSMVRWADKTFPTLGGCMSEDLVGTNSDGTAIEEGGAVQVWGSEHFNEALQDSFCTSVPIRDPLRRSIRAVLSLSFPARVAEKCDPRSVLLTVQGAAAEVARSLAARLAAREQALLSEYLREVRKRGADAVVAMDEHTTIASRGAMQLLEQSDYAVLAAYARDAGRSDQPVEHEVQCGSGRMLQLQARPVSTGDSASGTVMRLRQIELQPGSGAATRRAGRRDGFAELIGDSLVLRRAVEVASTAASRGLGACIVGEPGTGKRQLAAALARRLSEQTCIYDCAASTHGTALDFEKLAAELCEGHAWVFHQVESLHAEPRAHLAEYLAQLGQPRVVLTTTKVTDELLPLISAVQGVEVQMPPLRARREDIPLLVSHFLGRLEQPGRASSRLLETLAAAEWPGNVEQLKEVIEAAALRSNGPEIRVEDLTELHRRALARSRLSRLQRAELEQIREALTEAGGNRVRAATLLRIGRSTSTPVVASSWSWIRRFAPTCLTRHAAQDLLAA